MSETGFRVATDGTRLFTHHWPAPEPRAAMVVVHGLGEHMGRYDHVGEAFAATGIDTRGSDTRGFGASEGPRAYVDSFETLLDDIEGDVTAARRRGVPVVLLGHSLGGLEALLYAASERRSPSLLVLSAPALSNPLSAPKKALVRVLSRIAPRLTIANPVDVTQLSRDQVVGERYRADPLVIQKSTLGLAMAAFDALDEVPAAMGRLALPTLVIHSGQDQIVPPSVSEPLADLPTVERVVFEDFRHESFNEEGGEVAVETVANWISRQLTST